MAHSQLQKEETEVHIKASADKVYDVFCNKTYLVANIFPEIVQSVEIQQGQWGTDKSIIIWTYFHGMYSNFIFKMKGSHQINLSLHKMIRNSLKPEKSYIISI